MQEAENYANNKKNELQKFINQLYESQKNAQLASEAELKISNDQLINNLNNQIPGINKAAEQNSRQAFINKMLGNKTVNQSLSEAGINTSGKVGTAQAKVENQYGKNLNDILINKNNQLYEINNQKNNANVEYTKNLANLKAKNETNNLSTQQYIQQLQQSAYDNALNNYLNNQQQKFNNDMTLKQYQNSLKQQQFENNYKNNTLSEEKFDFDDSNNNASRKTNTLTTEGNSWYGKLKNVEQLHGRVSTEYELKTGITEALKAGLLTEDDAILILREYGYMK